MEEEIITQLETTAKTYSEEEYNKIVGELNSVKEQLGTANETIKSYTEMDIDGIKASVQDYKQKWEKSEADRKAFEHKTKVNGFVKSLGLKDDIYEKHVSDIIIEKGLKFDGEKLIGGDDVVSVFRDKYPDAFRTAEPVPKVSVSTTGDSTVKDRTSLFRAAAGLK